jgi:hypothetical protein
MGELRFARAPDVVDTEQITVGVRRAVMLPLLTDCRAKVGSLYRPTVPPNGAEGAAQIVFSAEAAHAADVLEGDQLKGEALGRFVATGDTAGSSPTVDVLVQIENAVDLCVSFVNALPGRSITQRKIAEKWIALQISRTIQEPDGSLRIASCAVRWKSDS